MGRQQKPNGELRGQMKAEKRESEDMVIDHRRYVFRVGNDLPDPMRHPSTIPW
eukprot:gene4407-20634_t